MIGQVRKARLISRSWLTADPVVARLQPHMNNHALPVPLPSQVFLEGAWRRVAVIFLGVFSKSRQDAPKMPPRCPQDAPRRPQDAPRRPQEAPKTPQGSENGAKMEASWHPNRSKWKVHCGNRKISQTTLSLQCGLDFRGFEVSFSDVKSMVFRRFFREASPRRPKKLPRRPRTPPRRPETPPRRAQGATRRPRSTPRGPQEEAQHEPGVEKIGAEKRSPVEPPPNLDFRASWDRF